MSPFKFKRNSHSERQLLVRPRPLNNAGKAKVYEKFSQEESPGPAAQTSLACCSDEGNISVSSSGCSSHGLLSTFVSGDISTVTTTRLQSGSPHWWHPQFL